MVYYSQKAFDDLEMLFVGLVNWQTENGQKHLDFNLAMKYFNDVKLSYDAIDKLSHHRKASYIDHKKHAEYVYQYKRNSKTSWYACYDKIGGDIFVKRVLSNYKTIET